jgi:hypothetical protein
MFEVLADISAEQEGVQGTAGTDLHRWHANGRYNMIMEMGAWHGVTTCGLFQQKMFRIDAQRTFGVDRNWKHTVLAVDDWLPPVSARAPVEGIAPPPPSPPPPAPLHPGDSLHGHMGKPTAYWQFVCNLQNAWNGSRAASAWTEDCPRDPEQRVVPLIVHDAFQGSHAAAALNRVGVKPDLMYFNPPREPHADNVGFSSGLRELDHLWDAVLSCNGSFVGHGYENGSFVQQAVDAFASSRRGLVVDKWWVHAPRTKWEKIFEWDNPFALVKRQPFAAWAVRHKQCES